MKFIFVYIVLLTNTLFCELAAQNLVPDAGFENIRRLPKRKDNSVSCTKNWMCPTDYGAADYYHKAMAKHQEIFLEGKNHMRVKLTVACAFEKNLWNMFLPN